MFSGKDLDPLFGENTTICLLGKLHPRTTRRTFVPQIYLHYKQGSKALLLGVLSS